MPRHLRKGLGNGGDVTQSELGRMGAVREMPVGGWAVGGGKGKVVVDWWYGWFFVM